MHFTMKMRSVRLAYRTGRMLEALEPRTLLAADLVGNTMATAKAITLTNTASVFNDAVTIIDKNDYYEFTLTSPKTVNIGLSGLSDDADVSLVTSTGRLVATSSNAGSQDESISALVAAGTYYVRVFPYGASETLYRLQASVSAAPADDAGNTRLTARDIGTIDATTVSFNDAVNPIDTQDWYKFAISSKTPVVINLDNLSANATLQLMSKTGALMVSSAHVGTLAETISRTLAAGTYYARVLPVAKANTSYRLTFSTGGVTPVVDPINGNVIQPGVNPVVNSRTLAGVSELNVAGTDADDTIVVTQSGGTLTINANGVISTQPATFADVAVFGFGGNDTITVNSSVTLSVRAYGGAGNDTIENRTSGASTIVTIGGGSDTVTGNGVDTYFWVDTGDVVNASIAEASAKHVHRVASFYQPFTTVAASANYVPLELNSQNLPDPSDSGAKSQLARNFWGGTPKAADVNQGESGDCYLLSTFGALAYSSPSALMNMAADLGDGTYAVQFYVNGVSKVVRLDGELPSDNSGILYSMPATNGGQWGSILEKAYALFATGQHTYAAIDGGWMADVFTDLGVDNVDKPATVSDTTLYATITTAIDAGKAVTVGTNYYIVGGAPIIDGHAYTVMGTQYSGGVLLITMRNPWGIDGVDNASDPDDGIVTVTGAQVRANCDWFSIAI